MKQETFKFTDIIVLTIALVFLFLLFGCTNINNNTNSVQPGAHFSYTSTTSFPFAVKFINQSVATAPGANYYWDMSDGTAYTNRPDSFIHTYAVNALYQVKLIKIESNGDMDTATVAIDLTDSVGPSGQSARTTAATAFTYRLVYRTTFTNTSTDATSYLWDFGDGTTSTNTSATFTKDFDTPGAHTVKLKAFGPSNEVDSTTAVLIF
ncbi:MAG: PKD domain-containing protein [Ferruginibacter sp.]